MEFASDEIFSWSQFTDFVSRLSGEWVYRGQHRDWKLRSSLERSLGNWDVDLSNAPKIEEQLDREFKRQYRSDGQNAVNSDTFYRLALMQHHGAPTRLLDWTYSPFVAAKFAMEAGAKDAVVWCLNTVWNYEAAAKVVGEDEIKARNEDSLRNDKSFCPLYMPEGTRHKFVYAENATQLNERLIIQQGVFMCPGDVGSTFLENLKAMEGWDSKHNILKLRLKMTSQELFRFVVALRRMNVHSAVLFPGLDGFARSLHERIPLMTDFANRNIGKQNHKTGSTI